MTAERNKSATRAFFAALEAGDADGVAALFAPEGRHLNPYHCGLFPEGAEGRAAIRAYWAPVFPAFDGMRFDLHELAAMEGSAVFARFTGRIKLKNGAGWYENDYFATFRFNPVGEIIEYVEIFNPVTAARGFGLMDKLSA